MNEAATVRGARTGLHAALSQAASVTPSKRISVAVMKRQSIAQARDSLLHSQASAPTHAVLHSDNSEKASQPDQQPFSRELQPLINSKFSVREDESAQTATGVRARLLAAFVACDSAVSFRCGGEERRAHVRESFVLHKAFDYFILFVISANAICLAADSPLLDDNSRSARALRIFDVIFTIIFVAEATLKIFALGCFARYDAPALDEADTAPRHRSGSVLTEASQDTARLSRNDSHESTTSSQAEASQQARQPYCLNGWNQLDFIIVVVGLLEFVPSIGSGSSALRALRVLRPLRAVNKLKSLRVIVTTLFNTLPDLAQVAVVLTFMFLIFGIMGLQLFNGVLRNRCVDSITGEALDDGEYICNPQPTGGGRACPSTAQCLPVGDNLGNGVLHFDDIGHSLLAVYLIADMSGWAEMMYAVQDATGKAAWIYFTVIIISISFFAMNLVLAVVVQEFETVSSDEDELAALAKEQAALEQDLQAMGPQQGPGQHEPTRAAHSLMQVDASAAGNEAAADGVLLALTMRAAAGALPVYEFRGPEDFVPAQQSAVAGDIAHRPVQPAVPFRSKLVKSERMGSGELHSYAAELTAGQTTVHVFVGQEDAALSSASVYRPAEMLRDLLSPPTASPPAAAHAGLREINLPIAAGTAKVFVFEDSSEVAASCIDQTPSSAEAVTNRTEVLLQLPHIPQEAAADGRLLHLSTQSGIRLFEFRSMDVHQSPGRSFGAGGMAAASPAHQARARIAQAAHPAAHSPEAYAHQVAQGIKSDVAVDAEIEKLLAILWAAEHTKQTDEEGLEEKPQAEHPPIPEMSIEQKLAARDMLHSAETVIRQEAQWLVDKPQWLLPIFALISSTPFQAVVNAAIVVNTIVLAIDHYGIDETQSSALDAANLFFTVFFLVEIVLKVLALGPRGFARDTFNLFDAAVVCASLVELAVANGGGVISVLRSLRLIRLLRLLKQFPSLRVLLSTVAQSIPDVSWMALLMALFVFIFAVLGQQLFAGSLAGLSDPPVFTFETFGDSLLTSITILSNDDWDEIMFDGVRCCGEGVVAFFLIGQMLGMYIILSLFIAILLRRFSEQDDSAFDAEDLSIFVLKLRQQQMKASLAEGKVHGNNGIIAAAALRAQVLQVQRAQVRKQQKAEHNRKVPEGMTGYSCGLSPPDAPLRVFLFRMVSSSVFEVVIFGLIILNCVFLALDRPTLDSTSGLAKAIRGMDFFFAFVFLLEMLAKIVAHGLWHQDGRGYFRNSWNILDSVVVVISFVSLGFPQVSVARALRALRPLRLVVRSKNIQVVVNALIAALPGMANVILLASVLWTIFAIMGTNLFKGGFFECSDSRFDSRSTCEAAANSNTTSVWQPIDGTEFANFNNVGNSMLLLFQIATLSGWGQLMHATIAVRGEDLAPQPGNNPAAALYFIAFVVIGGFFMINLAVGVVIDNFNRLKALYDGSAFLTKAQQRYYYTKKIVFAAQTQLTTLLDKPRAEWRQKFHAVATSPRFEHFIFSCIVLNTVLMMTQHFNQPSALTDSLFVFNILFVLVFTCEAAVKVIGVRGGLRTYWKDAWNKFDALVVILSYVSLFSDSGAGASVIRVFRVVRIFRLIKSAPTLRKLTQTLLLSAPSLLNIGALLAVIFFMLSVLGVSLFGDVTPQNDTAINRHANFVDFGDSLELTWRISTGDAWEQPMYAIMAQKGGGAAIFFVAVQLILSFVFLQLFIAVILEQFGEDLEARISAPATEDESDAQQQPAELSADTKAVGATRREIRLPPDGVNGFAPPGWTSMMSLQAWATMWNKLDTLATQHVKASLFGLLMQGVPPPFGFGTSQLASLEVLKRCTALKIPIFMVQAVLVKRQRADLGQAPAAVPEEKPRTGPAKPSCLEFLKSCMGPASMLSPNSTQNPVVSDENSDHALRAGVESRAQRKQHEWCLRFESTLLALAQVALNMDISQEDGSPIGSSWFLHEYLAVGLIEHWWGGRTPGKGFQTRGKLFGPRHSRPLDAQLQSNGSQSATSKQSKLLQPTLPNRSAAKSLLQEPLEQAPAKQRSTSKNTSQNSNSEVAHAANSASISMQTVLQPLQSPQLPALPGAQAGDASAMTTSTPAASFEQPRAQFQVKHNQGAQVASPSRQRALRALDRARMHLDTGHGESTSRIARQNHSAVALSSRQVRLNPASAVRIKLALKRKSRVDK